jgi:uncharacterized membrane protein
VLFVVAPALTANSWVNALIMGMLLGLFAYGTYDLTNLAIIRNWPWQLSLVDMAWGGVLTGIAATAGYVAARAAN